MPKPFVFHKKRA